MILALGASFIFAALSGAILAVITPEDEERMQGTDNRREKK